MDSRGPLGKGKKWHLRDRDFGTMLNGFVRGQKKAKSGPGRAPMVTNGKRFEYSGKDHLNCFKKELKAQSSAV